MWFKAGDCVILNFHGSRVPVKIVSEKASLGESKYLVRQLLGDDAKEYETDLLELLGFLQRPTATEELLYGAQVPSNIEKLITFAENYTHGK